MDEVVLVVQVVSGTRSAHVTLFVNVYSVILSYHGPDAQIELSLLVQKWPFNILLYYPESLFLLLFEYEFYDVTKFFEYFDAAALV